MTSRIKKLTQEKSYKAFSKKGSSTFEIVTSQNPFGNASEKPDRSMQKFIESYGNFVWVYACIYAIANAAAGVRLALYAVDDEGNLEEQVNHPLLDLMTNPNPKCTRNDLIETTFIHLESTGNAFWEIVRDETGQPKELYPLRPTRIEIVPDPVNYIKKYIFTVNSRKIDLLPDDIIHFKYPDPNNDYWGISPLAAASDSLLQETNAIEYNKKFFSNSARPDVIFHVQGGLTPKNFNRMKTMIKKMFGGVDKAHSAAIIEGGIKIEQVGFAPKDLEFLLLRKYNRDELMSVFGVPPALVGVFEQAIRANARVQVQTFWETTMVHKLDKIESKLNYELTSEYKNEYEGKKLILKWVLSDVPALGEITKEQTDIVRSKVDGGLISRNEGRLELGYETIPGLDTIFIPLNVQTLDNALMANPGLQDQINPNPSGAIPTVMFAKPGMSKEKAEMIRKNIDSIRRPFEKQMEKELNQYFIRLKNRILQKLETLFKYKDKKMYTKTISVEVLFPEKENKEQMQEIVEGNMASIVRTAGNSAILEIALDLQLGAIPGLIENSLLRDFIKDRAFNAATSITETTKNNLRKILEDAFEENATLPEIRHKITRALRGKLSKARIKTIADTEMGIGLSKGRRVAMEQILELSPDTKLRKIWISVRDDKVRASHVVNDQESNANPLAIDAPYPNGLLHPLEATGDPGEILNCRCIEAYVSGSIPYRNLNGPIPLKKVRFVDGTKIVSVKTRLTYKERLHRELVSVVLKSFKSNGKDTGKRTRK